VLTVGPHVNYRPYTDFVVNDVLFPTKPGAHSDLAAGYAFSLVQETHGRITFMNVLPRDFSSQPGSEELADQIREDLLKMIAPDAKMWCDPKVVVRQGDPAVEIIRFAEQERPDLVVLGLPQKKTFNSHFRTGVTYNVVAGAPCPVLTIRDSSLKL